MAKMLINLLWKRKLSSKQMKNLASIRDSLSRTSIDDLETGQLLQFIGLVHNIVRSWSGKDAVADAMLQTVGVDVTVFQIAEGRKMDDSCAHELRYDDQRKFGRKTDPEAARIGLLHLVGRLLDSRSHADPTEFICELVDERWNRDAPTRNILYDIREVLLHQGDDTRDADLRENLKSVFESSGIKKLKTLPWE